MFKSLFAMFTIAAAAVLFAPSAVTAQQAPPTPSPMPSETAPPSPLPSASPSVTPSPAPSTSPTPLPTAKPLPTTTPLPTATPMPTPLVLPDDAPPQILAVTVSDPVFHSGETVTGTVITSTNVAAVEIRLAGRSMRLPRSDFGVFQMSYTMPRVPFWLRKTYTAQVVALNSAGLQAERDITVSVR